MRMKLQIEHDLPRKVRYGKMYLELGSASLYIDVNGSSASWVGSIGGRKRAAQVSDREYTRYRLVNPAMKIVDADSERVIVKSANGLEEEWVRPRWVLQGVRRSRDDKKLTA